MIRTDKSKQPLRKQKPDWLRSHSAKKRRPNDRRTVAFVQQQRLEAFDG